MTPLAARQPVGDPRAWPMTAEARAALEAEVERLATDVDRPLPAPPDDDGLVHLPTRNAARRLELLREVLEAGPTIAAPGVAAIGRQVTVADADGALERWRLVAPGDGDPGHGWISADSPLGRAVLGGVAGDRVVVQAPGGSWAVAIVAVE